MDSDLDRWPGDPTSAELALRWEREDLKQAELLLTAQCSEFKRRALSARKALEDIRTAYEAGDLSTIERLLNEHTAFTHTDVKRPKMEDNVIREQYFVLHSPYPDGTFRGIEKCYAGNPGTPLLFDSVGDAQAFAAVNHLGKDSHVPVCVELAFPGVRKLLNSVETGSGKC